MKFFSDVTAGQSKLMTWVSSGATPSSISVALIDVDELIVTSASMTSSGNGFYHYTMVMSYSPGFYRASFKAIVDGTPYIDEATFRILSGEIT